MIEGEGDTPVRSRSQRHALPGVVDGDDTRSEHSIGGLLVPECLLSRLPVDVVRQQDLSATRAVEGDPTTPEARGPNPLAHVWRARVKLELRPLAHADPSTWLTGHERLIRTLLAFPSEHYPAVQLQLLAIPSGQGPRLEVRCVLACSGTTRCHAELNARDLSMAFLAGFSLLGDAYGLHQPSAAVPSPATAENPPWEFVEIAPRCTGLSGDERATIPLPVPAPVETLADLCQALLMQAASGISCAWINTIEPVGEIDEIHQYLSDQVAGTQVALSDAQLRLSSSHGAVALQERAQQLWQVGNLTASFAQRVRGPLARVQSFVCCQGRPVPSWLVAATLAAVSGPLTDEGASPPEALRPVRPREREEAGAAVRLATCRAWEDAHRQVLGLMRVDGRLRRLAPPDDAWRRFRLPLPSADGLPGLPSAPSTAERWLSRVVAPTTDGGVLGDNVAGQARQPVVLSREDRRRHLYVVGQTGVGKSHLLEQLVVHDMEQGDGVIVIDPHGDLVEHLLARVPRHRKDDVILVDPASAERPVGFNLLDCPDPDQRYRVVEEFIGTLQKLYDPFNQGIVGPRFKHAVRNGMLTVMEASQGTLVELVRVLTDPSYVHHLLPKVQDPMVIRYWQDQVANTADFHKSEVLDYIVSKFSPFVSHPLMRNIVGQRRSAFRVRDVMDQGKILLVSLAQGRLGAEISRLLAAVFVPEILLAAFSRADLPEERRRDCFFYVDEFQHYASPTFVDILSGARKYRLNLAVGHQHVSQLDHETRSAVFGNVGTIVAFRVGVEDAPLLASALQPRGFSPVDYLGLPNHRAYARIAQGGRPSPCFSLATRHFPDPYDMAWAQQVRAASLQRWGQPRGLVQRELAARARL